MEDQIKKPAEKKKSNLINLCQNQYKQQDIEAVEAALVAGNLDGLSTIQRLIYYKNTCLTLGLNPLTKPFAYIKFSQKVDGQYIKVTQLYAKKDATDQLSKIHKVSIRTISRERVESVYVVHGQATLPDGRTVEDVGAVEIAGSQGKDLAVAIMKAETKMKRRVILSICGLGMLDESEIEVIPDAITYDAGAEAPKIEAKKEASSDEANAQVTIDQANILIKLAKDHGWPGKDLNKMLLETYQVGNPTKLKVHQYQEVQEIIQSTNPEEFFQK